MPNEYVARVQGAQGRLFADPQPTPDETSFQVDNTSSQYYDSPYYKLHKDEVQPVLTDVEGAMIGANLALCRRGNNAACDQAELIGRASYDRFGPGDPDSAYGPQFDTVFFRYMLQLSQRDHDRLWIPPITSVSWMNERAGLSYT